MWCKLIATDSLIDTSIELFKPNRVSLFIYLLLNINIQFRTVIASITIGPNDLFSFQ